MRADPLAGYAAVVLGAGPGIGAAVARGYAQAGAAVVVLSRAPLSVSDAAVQCVIGEAADHGAVAEALQVAAALNRPLINVTCCAGAFDRRARITDMSPEELTAAGAEIWSTNVLSCLLAANAAYPALKAAAGSLTLTLSESAYSARGGGVLYGSSKWALRGMVAHLASEFAPHVRVNAVSPGGTTHTAIDGLNTLKQQSVSSTAERDEQLRRATLLDVLSTPEDHVGAYVYLADPNSARIVTGMVLRTDGGTTSGSTP
jgi:2,3-dihydroxy-2,3-dihydrophenylpropionate dehydrogenase